MKILLINPFPYYSNGTDGTIYPPLGLLYIASYIKTKVEKINVLDANVLKLNIEETINKIKSLKPNIVGISVNVVTEKVVDELVKEIKQKFKNIIIIVGGPMATAFPERWSEKVNYVVLNEGEKNFTDLINGLQHGKKDFSEIPGIYEKNKKCSPAEFLDPNLLPFPAYDCLIPNLKYYSKNARIINYDMAPILTSRGCPYKCTFCDKTIHGNKFRARSADNVIEEINWLRKNYNVNQIDIIDDAFNFNKDRLNIIFDNIINNKINLSINCHNGLRVNQIDEQLVKKMKRAGVFKVGLGIESGSYKIINSIKKNIDLEHVKNVIRWFKKEKIVVHGFFIIGFPDETLEDIKKTLKFAIESDPDYANFSLFIPIPKTQIYEEIKSENRLLYDTSIGITNGYFRNKPFNSFKFMKSIELEKIYKKCWKKFYFRPKKILSIIKTFKSKSDFLWVLRIGFSMMKKFIFGK